MPRQILSRSGENLDICLNVYRYNRPKEFRKFARMNPSTFNALMQYLEPQEVFHNSSSNEQQQMPIDRQILLTLLRMGCYGNGASLDKIALLQGLVMVLWIVSVVV